MRIYLNEGKLNMMRKAFTQPGEAMESKLLAKVIASAQAKVKPSTLMVVKTCLNMMMWLMTNVMQFTNNVITCSITMTFQRRSKLSAVMYLTM